MKKNVWVADGQFLVKENSEEAPNGVVKKNPPKPMSLILQEVHLLTYVVAVKEKYAIELCDKC